MQMDSSSYHTSETINYDSKRQTWGFVYTSNRLRLHNPISRPLDRDLFLYRIGDL